MQGETGAAKRDCWQRPWRNLWGEGRWEAEAVPPGLGAVGRSGRAAAVPRALLYAGLAAWE